MQPIDIERCVRAMKNVKVFGVPNGSAERVGAIADAIAAIQKDGASALKREYIGVKNYAHFGDQRSDHENGYGPKHGYIVFSIRRVQADAVLGPDEVYLLECVRDFGHVADGQDEYGHPRHVNLCDALAAMMTAAERARYFRQAIGNAKVESHEVAAEPAPEAARDDAQARLARMREALTNVTVPIWAFIIRQHAAHTLTITTAGWQGCPNDLCRSFAAMYHQWSESPERQAMTAALADPAPAA